MWQKPYPDNFPVVLSRPCVYDFHFCMEIVDNTSNLCYSPLVSSLDRLDFGIQLVSSLECLEFGLQFYIALNIFSWSTEPGPGR